MILIDANLLLHAYNTSSEFHPKARPWLEKAFSGGEPVRMAWVTVLAFLRITTHSRIFPQPLSSQEATAIVSEWFQQPGFGILQPEERHWGILASFLDSLQVTGPLVMDAHLAALAIEHGAVLYTTDADFTRFPGLPFRNPLKD